MDLSNLNAQQFRSVSDVGQMGSQYEGRSLEEAYQSPHDSWLDPVSDAYAQQKGHANARDYHEALKADLQQNGMREPIALGTGWRRPTVDNGHHRWMAARDLGWANVPVEYKDHTGRPISRETFERQYPKAGG